MSCEWSCYATDKLMNWHEHVSRFCRPSQWECMNHACTGSEDQRQILVWLFPLFFSEMDLMITVVFKAHLIWKSAKSSFSSRSHMIFRIILHCCGLVRTGFMLDRVDFAINELIMEADSRSACEMYVSHKVRCVCITLYIHNSKKTTKNKKKSYFAMTVCVLCSDKDQAGCDMPSSVVSFLPLRCLTTVTVLSAD